MVKMLTNLYNSTDDYNGNLQKIIILQVIKFFLWNVKWRKKNCEQWCVFSVTNIRTNFQNDSSEFEGLIHEIVSHKSFSNQEICHINLNDEKSICTVSTYIKKYLSIVEIENTFFQRCSNMKPPAEVISDKLIMIIEGLPTSDSPRQIDHQNVLHWQRTLLFWMWCYRIISRINF